jgi:hypothetical protein
MCGKNNEPKTGLMDGVVHLILAASFDLKQEPERTDEANRIRFET